MRLMLAPCPALPRQGCLTIIPEEDSHTNRIHADDLARIVVAALRYSRRDASIHASDDSRLKMGEYFDLVADHFGLPRTTGASHVHRLREG